MLQIGPVIFGTALRDSLPFISFGDFVNQIDYAEVSRALNDKATSGFASEDREGAEGKTVSFAGAATAPSGSTPLTVTPVMLAVGRERAMTPRGRPADKVIMRAEQVSKVYPGTIALDGVDFRSAPAPSTCWSAKTAPASRR